jgi:RHS repeat-associated protein
MGDTPVAAITQVRTTDGNGVTTVQTKISYIYADHLDTPRVITRASDHFIQWRWDQSEAYGNTPANQNPNALGKFEFNLRFPGQLFDPESNLVYNHHRYYDASTGRYVESDPLGLDGDINTYSYVSGSPVSYFDPFGLCRCTAVPGSKESFAQDTWWGQTRTVSGKYACETDDKKKEDVKATHSEWYLHKQKSDNGREGNMLGQEYGTSVFNSHTYTYTYPQTGFASFDPKDSPSADLRAWATRCSCK